jgi:iron-sulfur cluster repair protein YtfE (RIC family)
MGQNDLIADTVKEAHDKIREILSRLQHLAKPLYLDIAQPLPYKILRNEIMIIETALTELFYLEEAILLPKAMEVRNRFDNDA